MESNSVPMSSNLQNLFVTPALYTNTEIATKRVHDFSGDVLRDWSHTYRFLGNLADLEFEASAPSPFLFGISDVAAMRHPSQCTFSQTFSEMWEVYGVDTCTHFIVLFIHPQASTSHEPSLPGNLDFLNAFAGTSHSGSPLVSPSTPLDHESGILSQGILHLSALTMTPNLILNVTAQLASEPYSAAASLSDMAPGTSIADVFQILQIQGAAMDKARYVEGVSNAQDALLLMVQNHASMSALLKIVGQPGFMDDPKAAHVQQYRNGYQLSSSEVIRHFGWSEMSYAKKSKLYKSALLASKRSHLTAGKSTFYILSYK